MSGNTLGISHDLLPFGLYFRQILLPQPQMKATTSEPEITTGDGNDPDKIDSDWIPDEDEDNEEENDEEASSKNE